MLLLWLFACATDEPLLCDDGVHEAGTTWDAGDCGNTCSCDEDGVSQGCTDLGCVDTDTDAAP